MILKIFNNKALRIALDIDDTLVSFNEQFFNDMLPYLNQGRFDKFMFGQKLNGIRINF